jgi:hypothetical protein
MKRFYWFVTNISLGTYPSISLVKTQADDDEDNHIIIFLPLLSSSVVGRPQTRWSDDLRKTAGRSWLRIAEDRAKW